MHRSMLIMAMLAACLYVNAQTTVRPAAFKGITGNVFDGQTRQPLPARIVISDDTGHVYGSYYKKLPGFFTEEDGSFKISLTAGRYTLSVYHGIDYVSQTAIIEVTDDEGVEAQVFLKPWHSLKKEGWYNGDGHDHLYTEKKPDTAMARLVRKICMAQGVDFMFTAQGWSGYNDSNWRAGYAQFSDDRFKMFYGSEMPKYRTGHTWWLGQQSTRGYFWQTMDSVYENHYYLKDSGIDWNFEQLPLCNIPDVEVVQRYKRADKSLAVIAHPTSWWWQKRGEVEKYVTNVTASLSYGLLSGQIWDGIVAMGYDHDHRYYQNLWFNILNQGYRMPAFAELDGGLGENDKFYYGSMRSYFKVQGEFSVDKLLRAAKEGRSFLTSGPILFADIDRKYQVGDVVPTGTSRVMNIKAYASGDTGDTLSYVIVFRNGKIHKLWDIRERATRTFSDTLQINEREKAWYIVKVYGKNAWKKHASLDIMRVCDKKSGDTPEAASGEMDVAFTNPFYFRGKNDIDPPVLQSKVNLTIAGNEKDLNIDILVAGKKIRTIRAGKGKTNFTMPVNAMLRIAADNERVVYRSLYLDYKPHRDLLEQLASGKWLKGHSVKYHPGEVPWSEFNFEQTKKILSNVNWEIDLRPNERDHLWAAFSELFR